MAFAVSRIMLLIEIVLFVYVVLSLIMAPYHPVRVALGRVIEPLLRPIRRVLPPIGGLDLSPLVLIVLVELIGRLLISVLS
jgi:YggT family protein